MTNERDVIEIQPELVPDVIKLFDADFFKMATCLQAQDDKVVLLNPRMNHQASIQQIQKEQEGRTDQTEHKEVAQNEVGALPEAVEVSDEKKD